MRLTSALPSWRPAAPAWNAARRAWRLRTPGPAARLAAGLVALMLSLLLFADLFVPGFLGNPRQAEHRERTLAAELIASHVSLALQHDDPAFLRATLQASLRSAPELRSARLIVRGAQQAIAGDHAHYWDLLPDAPSTISNLRMAVLSGGQRIGELQLAFEPAADTWEGLLQPAWVGALMMSTLGFVAFYLYVRRALRYLDPGAVVPERVRTAFDTLTQAVLVIDTNGCVMLANEALCALAPATAADSIGRPIDTLEWLAESLAAARVAPPWVATLADRKQRLGLRLRVTGGSQGPREVRLNTSPIIDTHSQVRGCLMTFEDVTQLHERKRRLRATIADLRATREEIARKNEELTLLATRDPLTGALNRRAFTQESERAFAAATAKGRPVSCIMCDVDHFKSINDRYGHAGGDEVLKSVTKALLRGLRTGDLLGRYGGEEFCILLPDASLDQATQIGERLRAEVEAHVGMALRQPSAVTVTMSFGVEQFNDGEAGKGIGPHLEHIVDRADQALYHAKKSGRNRVCAYPQLKVAV